MEATSSRGSKYTEVIRIIATNCNSPVLMIRHEWGDDNHEHPVDLYLWNPGKTGPRDGPDKVLEGASWDDVKRVMLNVHERHECA